MVYDLIIIGLGIAGINASIYAKRSGLNILTFECEMPGGLINKTNKIENYPGFKEISGPDLALKLYEQLTSLGIEQKMERVIEIRDYNKEKFVYTEKNVYKAKTVIIATGRKPKKLGALGEENLLGRGVSYCHLCDGNLYKNKNVAVIGGGNSAVTGAIYLSNICEKIYMIVRKGYLRSEKIYSEQLKKINNIEVIFNNEVKSFVEKDGVIHKIILNDSELLVDGAFINIGYEPATDFCKNLNIINDNGFILVNESMETEVSGIYAAGDIIQKNVYQLITAASEGVIAAISAYNYINYKQ